MTWTALGTPGQLPGPVTAVEVNGGNASSIFAAGRLVSNLPASTFSYVCVALWMVLLPFYRFGMATPGQR